LHLDEGRRRRVTKWRRFPPRGLQQAIKAINPECRKPRLGAVVEDSDGGDRQMQQCRYGVTGDFGEADVLVGQTMRYAWGRDRGRVVVFGKASGTGTSAYYPWTEFVETDDGDYAAKLSVPNDPRKSLRDGDPLPPRVASANVQRNDQIFRSIRDGAALRLVVAASDAEAMIAHAYWVASLRSRI